jgi:hypothetical protein
LRPGQIAVVPAIVADSGDRAAKRFLEYFGVTIRNRNTRMAYLHAARRFFTWCEREQIGQLVDIEPLHVGAYIEMLGDSFEKPTVKQHLAAIRKLFDWLVVGQILATNPAHAVRGPTHVVKSARPPCLMPTKRGFYSTAFPSPARSRNAAAQSKKDRAWWGCAIARSSAS